MVWFQSYNFENFNFFNIVRVDLLYVEEGRVEMSFCYFWTQIKIAVMLMNVANISKGMIDQKRTFVWRRLMTLEKAISFGAASVQLIDVWMIDWSGEAEPAATGSNGAFLHRYGQGLFLILQCNVHSPLLISAFWTNKCFAAERRCCKSLGCK